MGECTVIWGFGPLLSSCWLPFIISRGHVGEKLLRREWAAISLALWCSSPSILNQRNCCCLVTKFKCLPVFQSWVLSCSYCTLPLFLCSPCLIPKKAEWEKSNVKYFSPGLNWICYSISEITDVLSGSIIYIAETWPLKRECLIIMQQKLSFVSRVKTSEILVARLGQLVTLIHKDIHY